MYYINNSTNRFEATLPGFNVIEVENNKRQGQSSYKIKSVVYGGLKRQITNIAISDSHNIVETKYEVIEFIFNV